MANDKPRRPFRLSVKAFLIVAVIEQLPLRLMEAFMSNCSRSFR